MTAQIAFRREAVEARRRTWLGSVTLSQPVQWWWLTSAALLFAVALLALLVFGSYTQRAVFDTRIAAAPGASVWIAVPAHVDAGVRVGQVVTLHSPRHRAAAEGRIVRVARDDDGALRALVALEAGSELAPGERHHVVIALETRRIHRWILAPLRTR